MNISRDAYLFNDCLERISKLAADHYDGKDEKNFEIDPKEMALVERYLAGEIEYNALSREAAMYCSLKSLHDQRKDPYPYSRLADVLELETWAPKDALLILSGIDPHAAIFEWDYENFMGARIDVPKIKHAICFSDRGDLYDYPIVDDFEFSPSEVKRKIRDAEKRGSTEEERPRYTPDWPR